PRLLEFAARYRAEQPNGFAFVFMGQGEVAIPRAGWAHDLGRVDEMTKRSVLAGAAALVQLSRQESLSLVALEAWAEGTPVLAHTQCAVLTGRVGRADGGVVVEDYDGFAAALDDVRHHEETWRRRGASGQAY